MKIFQTTNIPDSHKEFKLSKKVNWYTWSQEMNNFLSIWSKEVRKTNQIRRIYMSNQKYIHNTYTLKISKIENKELRKQLYDIADSFYNFKHNSQPIFFKNMINKNITFNGLHCFFAALREILIRKMNDRWSVIYSPVFTQQKNNEREFPLHYDMFIPKILFMIYNNVPQGRQGASTFLSTKELKKILSKTKLFPSKKRKLVMDMLRKTERKGDQYGAFMDLIHDKNNEWYKELHDKMESKKQIVKFKAGEGFLVHDRLWMHGRTKTRKNVNIKRLMRFVFNTQKITEKESIQV